MFLGFLFGLTSLLSFGGPSVTWALDVPANTAPVVDLAGLLDPGQKQQLDVSLLRFQKEFGPQIQVLTIPTLAGDVLEDFSIRVADAWKTGEKGKDNGVILILATQEHKARIEVGRGLEGQLPDITAGRIIRDTLIPFFKAERYSDGVLATTQEIATHLGGALKAAPSYGESPAGQSEPRSHPLGNLLPLIILLFVVLPRLFGGNRYRRGSAGSLAQGLILGGLLGGGRSSGGGGSGGGFFGGGGGGGFNGGGSSGQW